MDQVGVLVQEGGVLLQQIGDEAGARKKVLVIIVPDHLAAFFICALADFQLIDCRVGAVDGLGEFIQGLGIDGDGKDRHHADQRERDDLPEHGPVKKDRAALFRVENKAVRFHRAADKIVADDDGISQAQQQRQDEAHVGPEQDLPVVGKNVFLVRCGAEYHTTAVFPGDHIAVHPVDGHAAGISAPEDCLGKPRLLNGGTAQIHGAVVIIQEGLGDRVDAEGIAVVFYDHAVQRNGGILQCLHLQIQNGGVGPQNQRIRLLVIASAHGVKIVFAIVVGLNDGHHLSVDTLGAPHKR